MTRVALRASLLGALLVVAGACGEYPGVPHALAGGDALLASWAGPGLAAPQQGSPGAPAPGGGAKPAALPAATIGFKDFELDPNEVTVAAGVVRFTLVNEGRYTHDFRVEGNGVDQNSPRIGTGRTLTWELALVPGAYKISCPISNHADRGMTGTLVVLSP